MQIVIPCYCQFPRTPPISTLFPYTTLFRSPPCRISCHIEVNELRQGFGHGSFSVCSTISSMQDRKSTRLNSSHVASTYAVSCLKKNTDLTRVRVSTLITMRTETHTHRTQGT